MTFKNALAVCGVLALAAIPSFADVLGSPLQDYGALDECVGCLFPVIQFTAANAGQLVTSFSFYAGTGNSAYSSDNAKVTSNDLTPILFEETSVGVFQILGIGQTVLGFTDGAVNKEPFVLASGSAKVQDANTFFGYVDGTAGGTGNSGTVSMNYPDYTGPVLYFSQMTGALSAGEPIDMTPLADIGQGTRTYALQVTTPEPGFYGVFALCLTGLIAALRRKKSA